MRFVSAALAAFLCAGFSQTVASARIVYVNRAATGAQNGSSWQDAYTSIQRGVDDAGMGDEVWVAAGTYVENVNLHSNIGLYGGFQGTESQRQDRNPAVNFTSIDGAGQGSCVSFDFGAGPRTILDGFRLRNGRDNNGGGGGGGVFVSNSVTGTISNNVITENTGSQGTAIASQYASVTIANNLIAHNTGSNPIVAYSGTPRNSDRDAPKIVNNTIVDNHGENGQETDAVVMAGLSGAVFANNIVALNDYGVSIDTAAAVTVSNNDVFGNTAGNWQNADPTGSNWNISEDPLFADEGSDNYRIIPGSPGENTGGNPLVIGNVDLDNQARIRNGAVDIGAYEIGGGRYHLVFSTQPAGGDPGAALATQPIVTVEDENGNRVRNYSGTVTVAIDPGSGNPTATLNGTTTVTVASGVARFNSLSVSATGSGFVLNATTSGSAMPAQSRMFSVHGARMYVRTDGDDGNDGLSWSTAKQTVQAALDQSPEEVWVAQGNYQEHLTINSAVSLYGGFTGHENSLTDRDPEGRTTLDGTNDGTVLTSDAANSVTHAGLNTLDGFVIVYGNAGNGRGGGAYLTGFRGMISNVEFNSNTAGESGGGLFLDSRSQSEPADIALTNVSFHNNSAGTGGGLYADTGDNWNLDHHIIHFSNTVFDSNVAAWGGGAYFTGRDMQFRDGATFNGNVATLGGGLYVQGSVDLNTGSFSGNGTANAPADAAGGGVYVDGGGSFNGTNVYFQDHVLTAPGFTTRGGAAAAMNGGSLYLYAVILSGNTADTGGAVYAGPNSNVWLTHVSMAGNTARGSGGGAYLRGGAVYVETSLIAHNMAGATSPTAFGGGLVLDHAPLNQTPASPAILLNATIADNRAPAGAGGLEIRGGSLVRLTNNIVAFNNSGIRMDASSRATFYNNDVFGNTPGADFQGFTAPTGARGNISQDPLFTSHVGGDYHLKPGSPAIDSGDSGPYNWYHQDVGNDPRVQGARVDMGAFEAAGSAPLFLQWDLQPAAGSGPGALATQPRLRVVDASGNTKTDYIGAVFIAIKPGTGTAAAVLNGTTTMFANAGVATFTDLTIDRGGTGYILTAKTAEAPPSDSNAFNVVLPIVRVSPTGNDANDGASWSAPRRSVQGAVDGTAKGGATWLAGGAYTGRATIRGTSLLGGFAGTEIDPSQRAAGGTSILDADHMAEALNIQSNEGQALTFDGLTIQNGVNNGAQAYPDNLTFSNNTFQNNTAGFGGGIISFGTNVRFTRNRFLGNTAQWGGGAMYLGGNNNTVDDSLFTGNATTYGGSAINIYASQPLTLANNTIAGNTGTAAAVYLYGTPATITNNIIANNGAGIARDAGATSTVTLSHNDVFANTAFNYQNLTAGATDISADPLFLNAAIGDYRLAANSPAVDAGDDAVLSFLTLDVAGNLRIAGVHVDIGALEYAPGGPYILADAVRALQIAAGLRAAAPADATRLNVDGIPGITTLDATHITRKAGGKEPNS